MVNLGALMTEPKCPSCFSPLLAIERRPDGDAVCQACKWRGKYALCFAPTPPKPSAPREWWLQEYLTGTHNGHVSIVDATPKFRVAEKREPGAFRVVEHSALTEAQEEIARLESKLTCERGMASDGYWKGLAEVSAENRNMVQKAFALEQKKVAHAEIHIREQLAQITTLEGELAEARAHALIRTNYINELLDKIVALEKECGRDPADY